jgi:hypothetical protein
MAGKEMAKDWWPRERVEKLISQLRKSQKQT